MRMHPFQRTELLVGREGWAKLQQSSVCVVGLGGIGSYAVEALVRAGVGHLTIVDFDDVCITNLNRQLHATRSTVGQSKAALMAARCRDINPKLEVRALPLFYSAETSDQILDRRYDYVVDAIDNMATKVHLLETCVASGQPVISAMGAGGRLDPTRIRVTDLSKSKNDPLARIVRDNLRQRGINDGILAVWTDEPPNDLDAEVQAGFKCICPDRENSPNSCDRKFQVQGTVSWMPPMFGLTLAGVVVNALLGHAVERDVEKVLPPRTPPAPERVSGDRRREILARARVALPMPVVSSPEGRPDAQEQP
jgi:tRNA A37 threonylcarbamoyladenosine dehydratase